VQGLGDGLLVDQCSVNGNVLGLLVDGCTGGTVSNWIGASITVKRSDAVVISAMHSETITPINLHDSNVIVRDCWLRSDEAHAIEMINFNDGRNIVSLENISFIYYLDAVPSPFSQDDVKLSAGGTAVSFKNCHRRTMQSGGISNTEQYGIRVIDHLDAGVDNFNNYSHLHSLDGFIETGNNVSLNKQAIFTDTVNTSLLGGITGLTTKTVWNEASDTYFYRASYVYDPVRMVGKGGSGGEVSQALTNGGDGMLLRILTGSTRSTKALCRIFRGTTTEMYSEYVDIPMIAIQYAYDRGGDCSGYEWISRTPGGADNLQDLAEFELNHNSFVGWATAAPTLGTWVIGDRMYNRGPSAGGTMGWVNTTGGSPGTWKTFGAITA